MNRCPVVALLWCVVGCCPSLAEPEKTWHAFDRRLIAESENVELVIGEPLADPEPLPLDGQPLWTKNNVHAAIQRDSGTGRWFGWRFPLVPVSGADDGRVPSAIKSDDGVSWHSVGDPQPLMGAILRDDREPDPERRFKTVFQGWAEFDDAGGLVRTVDKIQWAREGGRENPNLVRGIFSAVSSDGIGWRDHRVIVTESVPEGQRWWRPGQPGWAGGDNFPCLLWAPSLKKWVCFFRTNLDRGPGNRRERGIGRSASADFIHWEPHQLALHADADRQHALGRGKQDYYQLQAWPEGDVYLGALSVFHWQEDRVHLELVWSPDTVHWERIQPGRNLVPHGSPGGPGQGCRYAAMGPVHHIDRETWLYFGADDGRHNADKDRSGGLWRARFARGRLTGLASTRGEGVVRTRPVVLSGEPIGIDAEGGVTVRLLDADDPEKEVAVSAGRMAVIEIRIRDGIFYSISY